MTALRPEPRATTLTEKWGTATAEIFPDCEQTQTVVGNGSPARGRKAKRRIGDV